MVSESTAPTSIQELYSLQDEKAVEWGPPFPLQGKDTNSRCPSVLCQIYTLCQARSPAPFPFVPLPFPAQVYEGGSNVDQFVTRFLLKETANQIQSLLSSVESAVEAIEEQTSQIRYVQGTLHGHMGVCHTPARANLPLGQDICTLESWVTLGKPLHPSAPLFPEL